jgi:hypothetical protein
MERVHYYYGFLGNIILTHMWPVLLLNAAWQADKQQMQVRSQLSWPLDGSDRGSNPWSDALGANTVIITPPRRSFCFGEHVQSIILYTKMQLNIRNRFVRK